MVICLEQGADLHMAQLMPLPLTVSYFSKIQIGFSFLVPAHPGTSGQRALNVCVCVYLVSWPLVGAAGKPEQHRVTQEVQIRLKARHTEPSAELGRDWTVNQSGE